MIRWALILWLVGGTTQMPPERFATEELCQMAGQRAFATETMRNKDYRVPKGAPMKGIAERFACFQTETVPLRRSDVAPGRP